MTPQTVRALASDLRRDEGVRLYPYTDTVGKLTIGVGRNLSDRGISHAEADAMLARDIAEHWDGLATACPWVLALDAGRQRAMGNLAFWLGVAGLLKFTRTLRYLQAGQWEHAASALLDSKAARQAPARMARIAALVRDGVDAD